MIVVHCVFSFLAFIDTQTDITVSLIIMHDAYALFEIYYYYMRQIQLCVIENPRFINNTMLILMVGRS